MNGFFKFKFKTPESADTGAASETRHSKSSAAFSVGGNFILAGWFLSALLNPLAHAVFITQTGIWLFLVEFLSIFAGGGASGRMRRIAEMLSTAIGFIVIAIFAFAFGWLFLGNISLPIIFLWSTASKIFGARAAKARPYLPYTIPLLLGSLLVVFVFLGPELLVKLFPFPEEFDQYAPADWVARQESGEISGEFVDRPQTMLAWGVMYFGAVAIIESIRFTKRTKIVTQ